MSVAQPVKPVGDANVWLDWALTVVFNIVLPILTYAVLVDRVGALSALVLSAVWPMFELVLTLWRRGHVDEFSIFALITIVIGVGSSLLFTDPRLFLLKESVVTGVIGLVLLLSMVVGARPLMFYFGRKFATDGSRVQVEWWNGLWRYQGFRRTQYVLTTVWGGVFVLEAVVRALLGFALPVSTMVVINNVAPPVIIAGLVTFTIFFARRAQAAALRHDPNAQVVPPTA